MCASREGVTAGKKCDFVAIATSGHGAPAPEVGARGIVEKKTASGVGADSQGNPRAFRNDFGGRTRDCGEKPVQTSFAGDEFQAPRITMLEQFIMAFGDAQDVVQGFHPVPVNRIFSEQRNQDSPQGGMELLSFGEERARAARVVLRKCEQLGTSFRGNNTCKQKKTKQFFPRETGRGSKVVREIDG